MSQLSTIFRNLRDLFAQDLDQVRHELGERHDRTESRLDFAEPRLDASEKRLDTIESRAGFSEKKIDSAIDKADALAEELIQLKDLIEKRLDQFEKVIDQRIEDRFTSFEQLTDARLGSIESRLDIVEGKTDEQLKTLVQQFAQRANDFEYTIDDRLEQFDTAIDERLTNYETAVDMRFDDYTKANDERQTTYETNLDTRFEEYTNSNDERQVTYQAAVNNLFDQTRREHQEETAANFTAYTQQVDKRVDERLEQIEIRQEGQHQGLSAALQQNFEQHTRSLDLRVDDRQSHLEDNLDQRLNGFEKGIDTRLYTREKYVDDRLVRIGDDIVARTDLLLQHSEQRLDYLRRAMRIVLEARQEGAKIAAEHLSDFDRLTQARQDLAEIAAKVDTHLAQNADATQAHYFKIIEWKNEAVESLKRLTPDEKEVADYILSYVDRKNPDHESYAQTHLRRFIATLNRIPPPQKSTARLLELGSCFFFTPAIKKFSGYQQISCADWYEGAPRQVEQREVKQLTGSEAHNFETKFFNVETDRFPYDDQSFQVVLCGEMLEHLSHDPMHMFWEINRVLEKDGLLLLTTPNIISIRSLEGVLTGYPPYLWMKYNLTDPAQQHYHEHTPETVRTFLTAAGFSLVELETEDVWAKSNPATIELLKQLQFSVDLRKDNIFALARKTHDPIERYPETLYLPAETPKKAPTPPVEPGKKNGKKK